MTDGEATLACLEVSVQPDPAFVPTVRRFVGELCGRTLANAEITSMIVVATHELFDNAVRYGARETCAVRVDLRRAGDDVRVIIATRNRVNEDRKRTILEATERMRSSTGRADYARALLERVAETEGEGFGLGRVYTEAELDVSARFEGEHVVIEAEGRFPLKGP